MTCPVYIRTAGVLALAVAVSGWPSFAEQAGPRVTGQARPRSVGPASSSIDRQRLAAFEDAARRRLAYVPGEVLVKFRAGAAVSRRNRALAALRSRPTVGNLEWHGNVGRYVDAGQSDSVAMAAALAAEPDVEFAQPNYIRRMPRGADVAVREATVGARTAGVPNDPDFDDLQWNFTLINAPRAWDITPGGSPSVIVAVLDTGVSSEAAATVRTLWTGQRFEQVTVRFDRSPDLSASRIVSPRDVAFEPGGPVFDFDGHGTHVASTIAEDANNQLGLVGLAYNVRIMPVKVCVGFWELMIRRAALGVPGYLPVDAGGCTDADVIAGVQYAVANGARVINLSLGGAGESPAVRDALADAVRQGVFIATSAGNGFEDGNVVEYPAGYAPAINGLVSVGAVGKSRTRAYYSNTGTHVEVVAPGGSGRDATGGGDLGLVWQMTLLPTDTDPLRTSTPRFDRYVAVGYAGTSMATPHVSATAALLISQGIASPGAIEAVMKRTALDLGSTGRDNDYGYGLIQPRAALFGLGVR